MTAKSSRRESVPRTAWAARAAGKWLAGMLSYELGYAFSAKLAPLMPEAREVPLLLFGVYDAPKAPQPDAPPRHTTVEPTVFFRA